MRRKLIAVLLAVALMASAVLCVGAALYSDTEGHWAEEYIDEATSRGLFSGVEDGTRFAPDAEMDRAMFVTALGRLAGIDPDDYETEFLATVFDDIDPNAYYAPYVSWAVTVGVASGIGGGKFAPNDPVSREQMACFVCNYLNVAGYDLSAPARQDGELPAEFIRTEFIPTPREDIQGDDLILPPDSFEDEEDIILPPDDFDDDDKPYFSDDDQIADWAKKSVAQMQKIGLLSGVPDGNGGFAFLPKKAAARAECAVLFVDLQDYLARMTPAKQITPENLVLNLDTAEVEAGVSTQLTAMVFPMDASQFVLWYSTDRAVATVDDSGCVTGVAEGEAEIRARMANGQEVCCSVTVTPAPEQPVSISVPQVDVPQSWYEKCMLVFGRLYEDPRLAYSGDEEARPHMTVIVVPAWDIDENGEKYTRYFNLQVHENVADIVQCIFAEIYALPEQVPIHSLGGYRWDGKCEHSIGLAIDINPAENYYCKNDGTAVVGKYFKPGEDPYSIPVKGAVDQIFAKYGFKRGIYWHSGYKDYMHYSFFGT